MNASNQWPEQRYDSAVTLIRDRHAVAVSRILADLLPTAVQNHPADTTFRCLEIGCGKSLTYTGGLLRLLAEAGLKRVELNLIDPLLDEGRLDRIRTSFREFDEFSVEGFQNTWEQWQKRQGHRMDGFDLAVSIQFTSLLSSGYLDCYFKQLSQVLNPLAAIVDVCEDNDTLTDPDTWGNLTLFQRDAEARIQSATLAGFSIERSFTQFAHTETPDDGQQMTGLLLKPSVKARAIGVSA